MQINPLWWGTATSSVQTEGASPTDTWYGWERAGRAPASGRGTDFATHFADDFARLTELGITNHRLSVNWARVQPAVGETDELEVQRYRQILTAGRDAGLRIWVTLLHGAIPQWFAAEDGFAGPRAADRWESWVRVAAERFADVAGGWMPVNNPAGFAVKGYLNGSFPPGHTDPAVFGPVLDVVARAEFDAARILAGTSLPRCSIEGLVPLVPADDTPAAAAQTQRLDHVIWGTWLKLARMPEYAAAFDYIGFSYYFGARIDGQGKQLLQPPDGQAGPLGYVPWAGGLRQVLDRLSQELPGQRLVIAELGFGGGDQGRIAYLREALDHIRRARDDGVPVEGVFFWTDVDNYEWNAGYTVPFGLFDSARKAKPSAHYVRDIIASS